MTVMTYHCASACQMAMQWLRRRGKLVVAASPLFSINIWDVLNCRLLACCMLEAIGFRLIMASWPVIIVNVYQPGSKWSSSVFFEELTSLLEMLVVYSCLVVVDGVLTCTFTMRTVLTLASYPASRSRLSGFNMYTAWHTAPATRLVWSSHLLIDLLTTSALSRSAQYRIMRSSSAACQWVLTHHRSLND